MHLAIASLLSALASVAVTAAMERWLEEVSLFGGFFRLSLSHNPGIAFGIQLPASIQSGFIVLALLLLIVVAARSKPDRLGTLAFGLVIGGATANIFDRLGDGLVTDYISIGTFPVFNAADACISIGVGLLLLDAWVNRKLRN